LKCLWGCFLHILEYLIQLYMIIEFVGWFSPGTSVSSIDIIDWHNFDWITVQ
jgi:hypothetical protein